MSESEISARLTALAIKKASGGLSDAEQQEATELRQQLALLKAQKGANR